MNYYTSDLHLKHDNIIKYCHRPCTPETHQEWLYGFFNGFKRGDHLTILGDVIFKPKLQDLIDFFGVIHDQGVELDIVIGNHDEPFLGMFAESYRKVFGVGGADHIKHYFLHRFNNPEIPFKKMVLCHYPMESWDGSYHGSVMLHGHTHGTAKPKYHRYDMGIDVSNKLFSFDDVIEMFKSDKNLNEELAVRTAM